MEILAFICFISLIIPNPGIDWLVPAKIIAGMFLHGISVALVTGPNNSATLQVVPHTQTAVSSAMLFSIFYLGAALTTAYCASVFPKDIHKKAANLLQTQTHVFYLFLLLSIVGTILCLIRPKKNEPRES
jgi:hypothetical protein